MAQHNQGGDVAIRLLMDWLDHRRDDLLELHETVAQDLIRKGIAKSHDPTAIQFKLVPISDDHVARHHGQGLAGFCPG